MKCVYCGTKLRNESNFCLGCGQPVNAMDCYIAEMQESGSMLTRETDKKSLDKIIKLTGKIFERTDANPDLKYEVRTFFESYLPRIAEARDDLTEVLDKTEEVFELMYAELCENDITELQMNIEALKAKIARDGLLKSDFDI